MFKVREFDHWDIANEPLMANPQMDHMWDIVIDNLDGMGLNDPSTGEPLVMPNANKSITISCQSCNEPSETGGSTPIQYYNVEFHVSNGQTRWESLKLNVRDLIGMNAYGIFKALKNAAADGKAGEGRLPVTDAEGNPGYMFTCHVIKRTTNRKITRMTKYEWAFVTMIGGRSNDRSRNGIQTFDVEIKFGRMSDEMIPQ